MQVPVTTQDKLEKIRKLIENNDTPMVTTVHGDKLISRPMKLQEAEFDGTLWFSPPGAPPSTPSFRKTRA